MNIAFRNFYGIIDSGGNMNIKATQLCEILQKYLIKFNIYEHEAVYTVEDVKNACLNIPGIPTKNLFLRDKKKNFYFVLVCQEDKRVDLKKLSNELELKNICFASENELQEFLGLELGDVGPFGIVNDINHRVEVLIDSELIDKKDINLSANSLTSTIAIDYSELIKFIEKNGNKFKVVDCN